MLSQFNTPTNPNPARRLQEWLAQKSNTQIAVLWTTLWLPIWVLLLDVYKWMVMPIVQFTGSIYVGASFLIWWIVILLSPIIYILARHDRRYY